MPAEVSRVVLAGNAQYTSFLRILRNMTRLNVGCRAQIKSSAGSSSFKDGELSRKASVSGAEASSAADTADGLNQVGASLLYALLLTVSIRWAQGFCMHRC